MRKHRIWYLAVTLTALIAYIVADKREPLVLLCILVLTPFLSMIFQRIAMAGIRAECHVPGTCRMGHEIEVCFQLHRKNRMPLGSVKLHIIFENILHGEQKEAEVWLQPGEHRNMSFAYPFTAENCGNMKIHVPAIECQDLLGLFVFRRHAGISGETLIYPPEIRLNTELLQRPETKSFGEMYDQQKRGQDVSESPGLYSRRLAEQYPLEIVRQAG